MLTVFARASTTAEHFNHTVMDEEYVLRYCSQTEVCVQLPCLLLARLFFRPHVRHSYTCTKRTYKCRNLTLQLFIAPTNVQHLNYDEILTSGVCIFAYSNHTRHETSICVIKWLHPDLKNSTASTKPTTKAVQTTLAAASKTSSSLLLNDTSCAESQLLRIHDVFKFPNCTI